MKVFAIILGVLVLASQAAAFFIFNYEKSTSWLVSDVILVVINATMVFIVANAKEAAPDKWKVYLPAICLMALIVMVVLPQAQTFSR